MEEQEKRYQISKKTSRVLTAIIPAALAFSSIITYKAILSGKPLAIVFAFLSTAAVCLAYFFNLKALHLDGKIVALRELRYDMERREESE